MTDEIDYTEAEHDATDATDVPEVSVDTSADRPAERGRRRRAAHRPAGAPAFVPPTASAEPPSTHVLPAEAAGESEAEPPPPPSIMFQAPDPEQPAPAHPAQPGEVSDADEPADEIEDDLTDLAADAESIHVDGEVDTDADSDDAADGEADEAAETEEAGEATEPSTGPRRRRRRGRRGRGRVRPDSDADTDGDEADESDGAAAAAVETGDESGDDAEAEAEQADESGDANGSSSTRRRRRRRRRSTGGSGASGDDSRDEDSDDEVRGVTGSTRLEAKRQRRRENRDYRRRPPVVTEAEFLARRELVDRVMVIRNAGERTQIAVLEDDVLVEHYVTRASSTSYAGNVYLGRVQNVLPSMEAAFVDIGKGRNGVLYAGEVNYDASALEGKPQKIEQALKPGQPVVVQVTKDPIGHKGARLTSQISLPGRYMVFVPEGGSAGISRKLPDSERTRLRSILKRITPENAGVIVRTAAEGATEEELSRDIARLSAQWEDIQKKAAKANPPALLYAEPDLVIRVVRDIFNEDFRELVVQGDDEWDMIEAYVGHVAPDLVPRLRRHVDNEDVFEAYRVDEQLLKALDRKVWLPSGGSLVFDRTEAMTVIDVNTGRYTGKGANNLEETVTRNNLEAAEEIVRQLRLRDIGGIIVVDFIDMVLESNRELVLRRLTECLGRDRTKHQVAEVTSLGLVQMTRKRVGQGLLEAYSEPCTTCNGKGVIVELPKPGATRSSRLRPVPRPPLARPQTPDVEAASAAAPEEPPAVATGAEPVQLAESGGNGEPPDAPVAVEPASAAEDATVEQPEAAAVDASSDGQPEAPVAGSEGDGQPAPASAQLSAADSS